MAAGLSQKQIYSRVYRRLMSLKGQLRKAGVNTLYKNRSLVFFDTADLHIDGGFNIKYRVSHASNGECAGFPTVYLAFEGKRENFGSALFEKSDGTFDQGLERIKALFSTRQPYMVGGSFEGFIQR